MNNIKTNLLLSKMIEFYEYAITIHKEDFAQVMLNEMFLVPRLDQDYIEFESPLLELLANYDMIHFQVSGIGFYPQSEWIYEGDYIYIGSDGCGDLICLHQETDAIYDYVDRIDYNKVSNNSFTFFESLLLVDMYNFSKSTPDKMDENDFLDQVAIDNYSRIFFKSLIV